MARELNIEQAPVNPGEDATDVEVGIRSDTERDMNVRHDAQDLILWVARVMGWSVTVDKAGGAEVDRGAGA